MTASTEDQNRSFIAGAFQQWAAGERDIFELLADDVNWHIAGDDPAVAQTSDSRQALLEATATPLRARLKTKLAPVVKRIWADGDDVIVYWEGSATFLDGSPYHNTYLWILTVKDSRIVAVTAFLDNAVFKTALTKPL